MPTQTQIESNQPLTEPTLFILLSLAPCQKHGYAIMKEVAALSEDRVQLSTGTLYGALKRLLDRKWIERVEEEAPTSGPGRPRKAYALTDLGRRALAAEVARLQDLVAVARMRVPGAAQLGVERGLPQASGAES